MSFRGYGGSEIREWLLLPVRRSGSLPAIVEFLGYGGGRGLPLESLAYDSAGFAHVILDTRGQGAHGGAATLPIPSAAARRFPDS